MRIHDGSRSEDVICELGTELHKPLTIREQVIAGPEMLGIYLECCRVLEDLRGCRW
jgi:hypothetical protein